jgi:hypothetical protein
LPVDGENLSVQFAGQIDFAAPQVSARGIPNSPSTRLPAGTPVTATITIKNTGTTTKDYFADARLRGQVLLPLLGSDTNGVGLPLSVAAQPNWLVPTGTRRFVVLAQGTVPIVNELTAANGDPDVIGVGLNDNMTIAQVSDPEVAPGFFVAVPNAKGPFPPDGVATGSTVNLAGFALTNPFDTAISADTGDVWALSVDPTAQISPLTLLPGQTGQITLTITPSAPRGTHVRGFIGVDTFNLDTLAGDELINIPYEYTVR